MFAIRSWQMALELNVLEEKEFRLASFFATERPSPLTLKLRSPKF